MNKKNIKTVGKCPICKADLVEIEDNKWICVNNTTGLCKFEIKMEFNGEKLTLDDLEEFSRIPLFDELMIGIRKLASREIAKQGVAYAHSTCAYCEPTDRTSNTVYFNIDKDGFFSCPKEKCTFKINPKYKGFHFSANELNGIARPKRPRTYTHTFTFRDENNNKILRRGCLELYTKNGFGMDKENEELATNIFKFIPEKL